ncbi:MAG: ABC transporter permease [Pseudonocardiaceae bacterium]|nr:ABC transporter permease [Pseudonocardiaceae bacterium]
MQDTASAAPGDAATVPPESPSRSFGRAFEDLSAGWRQRHLWGHLGWQDIKQGYRRSTLGPLWITISMAVTAVALGILYSALFQKPLEEFLPHVAVGLIVWQVIAGCVNQGANVFIRNDGLIKHLPAPISVHVYRLVWHQLLLFAHNLVVWVALMIVFPRALGFEVLLAIPAMALLLFNGVWFTLMIGIIATRFRDIPPLTTSIVQLMFFMTPIVWVYEDFLNSPNPDVAARARLAEINPFMHFLQIVRQPMIGDPIEGRYWVVALAITVAGWAMALLVLRNYRARVSYWV